MIPDLVGPEYVVYVVLLIWAVVGYLRARVRVRVRVRVRMRVRARARARVKVRVRARVRVRAFCRPRVRRVRGLIDLGGGGVPEGEG